MLKLSLLLSIVFVLTTACQMAPKTRKQIEDEKSKSVSGTPINVDTILDDKSPPAVEDVPVERTPPKVGVILSGGGMKTFAHIGVLKSFVTAKVPIHYIVGLEWGSIPAALYSVQGQVHDVEWKMFRLRESDLPEQGFFSSKVGREPVSKLDNFMNMAFAQSKLNEGPVKFSCPTYSLDKERLYWQRQGKYQDILKRCLPYPPFFKDNGGYIADPFALKESVKHLRARGAEIIIFVNVMEYGKIVETRARERYLVEQLLWNEVRRTTSGKQAGIDYIISVQTGSKTLFDLKDKRQLVQDGLRAAKSRLMKIGDKYEF